MSKLSPENVGAILNQITGEYNLLASQLFDNRYIWGYRHLYSAVWHALNAKKNDQMISKTLSIEVLLYVATERQIRKAITFLGVKETTKDITGVLLGDPVKHLINAYNQLQKKLCVTPNMDLLNDFSSKNQHLIKILMDDGYLARDFTFIDIEKAILQKIALLALE
ncbi:MAG: KEOPS complex subunit Cgi121 [Promethearchaeota archaeon]